MIKLNLNFKLFFLIKTILIILAFSSISYSEDIKFYEKKISIGSNEALVKVKIFSSFTCPHCANFHFKIIPLIKSEYVDAGKVQLIFVDFPLDQAAFNASKLLRCVKKNKQINFMDIIYQEQEEWTNGSNIEDINENLKKIVNDLGINPDQFDNCLNNEEISDKILNGRIDAHKKYSIDSTPTVIINEKKFKGSVNFKNIKKEIEKNI